MTEKSKIIKSTCKGCKAEIVWLQSHVSGKNVPVNPDGVEENDVFFNYKKHTSHFATCIYAAELRKNSKAKKGSVRNSEIVGEHNIPSVDEIIRERVRVSEEFKEKLAKDKRLFILKSKHPMTVWRYSLLNTCADAGLEFESLVNFDNSELQDWLAERDNMKDPLAPKGALPLGKGETFKQRSLFD